MAPLGFLLEVHLRCLVVWGENGRPAEVHRVKEKTRAEGQRQREDSEEGNNGAFFLF